MRVRIFLFLLAGSSVTLVTLAAGYIGVGPLGANSGAYIGNARSASAVAPTENIPVMTNAQKLSLPANTAVGTKVKVSDGFVVSGEGSANGFFAASGSTINGKPEYRHVPDVPPNNTPTGTTVRYDPDGFGPGQPGWILIDDADGTTFRAVSGNETFPWDADFSGGITNFTHPAVQQLQAPGSAQGGVFVSGGTQDGIYTKRGTHASKPYFNLIGWPDDDGSNVFAYAFLWTTDINIAFGIGPSSPGFIIASADGNLIYYSLSAVATPDLATNWKNASDDSPASISVASVTQGELDAGVTVAGAGTVTSNGTFVLNGNNNGNGVYGKVTNLNSTIQLPGSSFPFHIHDNNTGNDTYAGENFIAFPWMESVWELVNGDSPAPTVTRNNVAAETNWQVVP